MSNFQQAVRAIFAWPDRVRVFNMLLNVPTPYLLAYLRANCQDVEIFRIINRCGFDLPEEIVKAVVAFGVMPKRVKFKHPKKTKRDETPINFSINDKYWREIIRLNPPVANEIRESNKVLPKGMKKRMEKISTWV